ncbi:DUF58 domain-containing protein [Sulfitobacter sp.]|uniref:DUF58 domain-containing protein n=1 Tax=Sulfitobacter sp. TaxID=1903071 RepID=UPI0030016858
MSDPLSLRAGAETEAAALPALLARAEHLAGAVLLGAHGRRRAGSGDDFWQYRPAQMGDSRRAIDYRRSARGDTEFVREREWQIAQSVMLWVDQGASMRFTSSENFPQKIDRARVLGLALAILLNRGGERVGLTGTELPPRAGRPQIMALAQLFCRDDTTDYAPPEHRGMIPHARAVFISDFMGDLDGVRTALTKAADRGVRGVLCHVLDPAEEAFPFTGRTIFQSMGGTLSHETLKANDLKERYLERLAERKAELQSLCGLTGWRYGLHHTTNTVQAGLLWLYGALDAKAVAA